MDENHGESAAGSRVGLGPEHDGTAGRPRCPSSAEGPGARPEAGHHAAHLDETSGSAYLYSSMARVFREVGPDAYKVYLLKLLEDAGDPDDPVERMMIEQICLAHHNIGRLYVKAATAEHLEAESTYLGAAALLAGEFRRSTLALEEIRGRRRAAARPGSAPGGPAVSAATEGGPRGELWSSEEGLGHGGATIPITEPAAGGGRPPEQGPSNRARRRRA